jgi:hypothetical protein
LLKSDLLQRHPELTPPPAMLTNAVRVGAPTTSALPVLSLTNAVKP